MKTDSMVAIAGMAVVTYLARSGGFWLLSRFSVSPKIERWLGYIPGSIFSAIVAPAAFLSGIDDAIGACAVVLIILRTKNLLLSMLAGVALVWLVRHFGGL